VIEARQPTSSPHRNTDYATINASSSAVLSAEACRAQPMTMTKMGVDRLLDEWPLGAGRSGRRGASRVGLPAGDAPADIATQTWASHTLPWSKHCSSASLHGHVRAAERLIQAVRRHRP